MLKCMECRKAKVSCDEVKPSCRRCIKRQTACTYLEQDMTTRAIAQPSQSPSRNIGHVWYLGFNLCTRGENPEGLLSDAVQFQVRHP